MNPKGPGTRFKGCSLLRFPEYDKHVFGRHVRSYLRGQFGSLDDTHPFLTAMLYAVDRYEGRDHLVHHLEACKCVVVCDRYVPSNIAHQSAKSHGAWRTLARQIEEMEYGVFKMPEPDLVILLDLTAEQSFARTHARDTQPDLHQDNIAYMAKVREIYLELASTYRRWHVIECTYAHGKDRSIDDIHADIWDIVSPLVLADAPPQMSPFA